MKNWLGAFFLVLILYLLIRGVLLKFIGFAGIGLSKVSGGGATGTSGTTGNITGPVFQSGTDPNPGTYIAPGVSTNISNPNGDYSTPPTSEPSALPPLPSTMP